MVNNPEQIEMGDMAGMLGFLLRLAQTDAYERLFDGEALTDASLTELSILHLVQLNPGIRQGVLAKALRIKRAHMTKIVQALDERDLCRFTIPAEDRRAVQLWLTDAGQAMISTAWPSVCASESRVATGLTAPEAVTLKRLLRKFIGMPPLLQPLTEGSRR
ncbi:MAG: MarR family winged helix-turn-helix transcriptional regulator [Paracoccaceae bacterium]